MVEEAKQVKNDIVFGGLAVVLALCAAIGMVIGETTAALVTALLAVVFSILAKRD